MHFCFILGDIKDCSFYILVSVHYHCNIRFNFVFIKITSAKAPSEIPVARQIFLAVVGREQYALCFTALSRITLHVSDVFFHFKQSCCCGIKIIKYISLFTLGFGKGMKLSLPLLFIIQCYLQIFLR